MPNLKKNLCWQPIYKRLSGLGWAELLRFQNIDFIGDSLVNNVSIRGKRERDRKLNYSYSYLSYFLLKIKLPLNSVLIKN